MYDISLGNRLLPGLHKDQRNDAIKIPSDSNSEQFHNQQSTTLSNTLNKNISNIHQDDVPNSTGKQHTNPMVRFLG